MSTPCPKTEVWTLLHTYSDWSVIYFKVVQFCTKMNDRKMHRYSQIISNVKNVKIMLYFCQVLWSSIVLKLGRLIVSSSLQSIIVFIYIVSLFCLPGLQLQTCGSCIHWWGKLLEWHHVLLMELVFRCVCISCDSHVTHSLSHSRLASQISRVSQISQRTPLQHILAISPQWKLGSL